MRIVLTALVAMLVAAPVCAAGVFDGRWMIEDSGLTAVLELRQNASTRRVTGTLDIVGTVTALDGKVEGARVAIERMDGAPVLPGAVTITSDAGAVILDLKLQGSNPVRWRMLPMGGAGAATQAPSTTRDRAAPPTQSAPPSSAFRNATPNEFGGEWHTASHDGTSGEVAELQVSGNSIQGTVTAYSRGYFSGKVTVDAKVAVRGTYRNGSYDVQLTDTQSGSTATGSLRLRGEYLILLDGATERAGYAREGRSLEANAERSAEAAALARAIGGHVYSTSNQASGRGGFVGGRTKIAFCRDGSISYDASDVGSTGSMPGGAVSMGSSIARRGRWSIVLYAGAPAVRADWQGTGTSYSLVAYFRVSPSGDGRSATVDGRELPMTANC
jgi:hypothetical protein